MKKRLLIAVLVAGLILCSASVFWFVQGRQRHSDEYARLKSLPYLAFPNVAGFDESKISVTIHDRESVFSGINVYVSEDLESASLLDMDGRELHTFHDKRQDKPHNPYDDGMGKQAWKLIKPYSDGKYLVLYENLSLFMIDWNSNVIWEKRGNFHHDFSVAGNGDIIALEFEVVKREEIDTQQKIVDNVFVVMDGNGNVKRRFSITSVLSKAGLTETLDLNLEVDDFGGSPAIDVYHINTVQMIDKEVGPTAKRIFRKGDILTCLRNQNMIFSFNPDTMKIGWKLEIADLQLPHFPTLLANGNVLVFDNGLTREYSRVLEVDPITMTIEWQYPKRPHRGFFSPYRGAAQRLPNGNTLVTESHKGRVIEVTKEGRVVWEFFNPSMRKAGRAAIYRMMRVVDPKLFSRLDVGFLGARSKRS